MFRSQNPSSSPLFRRRQIPPRLDQEPPSHLQSRTISPPGNLHEPRHQRIASANGSSHGGRTPPLISRTVSIRNHHQQVEDLEHVFNKFDVNGDGKISSSEIRSIMSSLGQTVSDDEIHVMIREVNSDGDGFIDLREFIELNTKGVDSDEILLNLRKAFSVYDIDDNGSISAEELLKVMRSLGDSITIADCRKMIASVDTDGDSTICFEEFKVMMMIGAKFNCAN